MPYNHKVKLRGFGGGGWFRACRFGGSVNKIYTGGDRNNLYVSNDGAVSWTEVKGQLNGKTEDICVDPKDGDRLIIATDGGVFMSTDGGLTCSYKLSSIVNIKRGIKAADGWACTAVEINKINSNKMYAGSGGTGYCRRGTGRSINVKAGTKTFTAPKATFDTYYLVRIISTTENIDGVYKVASVTSLDSSTDTVTLSSKVYDFNDTWTGFTSNATITAYQAEYRSHWISQKEMWEIIYSSDGGSTWKDISSTMLSKNKPQCVYKIRSSWTNENVIYVATSDFTYKGVHEGGSSWTWTTLPQSSRPVQSAFDIWDDPSDPNILYLITAEGISDSGVWSYPAGNFYKSTDGGSTWVKKDTGLDASYCSGQELRFDKANNNILYFGNRNTAQSNGRIVYKSTNKGESWTPISFGSIPENHHRDNSFIATSFDVYDQSIMCVPGDLISRDGGATWDSSASIKKIVNSKTYYEGRGNEFINGFNTAFIPSTNGTRMFLASADFRLTDSADGGVSWKYSIDEHLYFPNGPTEYSFQTVSGTKTITSATSLDFSYTYYIRITNSTGADGFYHVSSRTGSGPYTYTLNYKYNYTNGKLTTTTFNNFSSSATCTVQLIYAANTGIFVYTSPQNENNVFLSVVDTQQSNNGMIVRSTDKGETWTCLTSATGLPTENTRWNTMNSCAINSSGHIFGGFHYNGIYKSTNNGDSWSKVYGGAENIRGAGVNVSIGSDGTLWASVRYPGSNTLYYGVFRSIDGGVNWTQITNGLNSYGTATSVTKITQDPTNPNIVWCSQGRSNFGIYKSTDKGLTWNLKFRPANDPDGYAIPSPHGVFMGVEVDPLNTNHIYAGTGESESDQFWYGQGLWKSEDGGTTWDYIPLPGNHASLAFCANWGSAVRKVYCSVDQKALYAVSADEFDTPSTDPPTVVSHPQSTSISVGEGATFTAAFSNATSYKWYKNSVEITGEVSPSYTITNAQLTDNGNIYKCRGTNSYGYTETDTATLTVTSPSQDYTVEWTNDGLKLLAASKIDTNGPASKIISAVKSTNELSVEAWIIPSQATLAYLSRIVTICPVGSERNFILSQHNTQYNYVMRTDSTDVYGNGGNQGIPAKGGTVATELTHVVTTYTGGIRKIYINGSLIVDNDDLDVALNPDLSSWNNNYYLSLGNIVDQEAGSHWLGEYKIVALYSVALTGAEVMQNYNYGPTLSDPVGSVAISQSPAGILSEGQSVTFTCTATNFSNPNYTWYKNDVQVGTNSDTYQFTTVANDNEATIYCNASDDIQNVKSNTLTLQIVSGMNLLLYNFNELSQNTINDSGPDPKIPVSMYGDYEWLNEQGIYFNGSTYGIKNGSGDVNSKMLEFQTAGKYTIEAWIKPGDINQGTVSVPAIFFGQNNSINYRCFSIGLSAGKYSFNLRHSDGPDAGTSFYSSVANVANDKPQHIVLTVEPTQYARLYINGVLNETFNLSAILDVYMRADWHNTIAGLPFGMSYYNGDIYKIAMHKSILNDSQILSNYNAGFTGYTPGEQNIVITTQPQNTSVIDQELAIMTCEFSGPSNKVYEWYLSSGTKLSDNSVYSQTNTSNLVIASSLELTSNSYYCKCINASTGDYLLSNNAILTVVLTAPTSLSSSILNNIITLYWTDNSLTEDGYIIERDKDGSGFTELTRVSADIFTYSDTVVDNGTYTYRVKAYQGIHGSQYSNTTSQLYTFAPSISWLDSGLSINKNSASIVTSTAPTTLINTLKNTSRFTLEMWIQPELVSQTGPAVILTNSSNKSSCNFELNQNGSKYQFRIRGTSTDLSGMAEAGVGDYLETGPVAEVALTHIVCTYDGVNTNIYINGAQAATHAQSVGSFTNWDNTYKIALGNELNKTDQINRNWLGDIYMIAFYSRALNGTEILQNYNAGEI